MKNVYFKGALIIFIVVLFSMSSVFGQGMGLRDGELQSATFSFPRGLGKDSQDRIYIADTYNNVIRILEEGMVKTFIGTGDEKDGYGYYLGGHRDGPLSTARFDKPSMVVFDSKGNMFVLDTGNHVIRKVTKDRVYTFAGSGKAGYRDGSDDTAMFNNPLGLAIDRDDNLYVADSFNNVIRKVDPKGRVTTLAGVYGDMGGYKDGDADTSLFNEPAAVVMGEDSTLYVADSGNHLIRKISNNQVTTFAGNKEYALKASPMTGYGEGGFKEGPKDEARFNFPKALALSDGGDLYVADSLNGSIRVILNDGNVITFVHGLDSPSGLLIHDGLLYVSDMYKNSVTAFDIDSHGDYLFENLGIKKGERRTAVILNSNRVEFPSSRPVADENDIFIPLKAFFKAWDAQVAVDGEMGLVKKGSFVRLYDDLISFDGEAMISGRQLTEAGFDVRWDPFYNTVIVRE